MIDGDFAKELNSVRRDKNGDRVNGRNVILTAVRGSYKELTVEQRNIENNNDRTTYFALPLRFNF